MTRYGKAQIIGKADELYEANLELLSDLVFNDVITNNTSAKACVEKRFEMWKAMLDGVLAGTEQGPRLFPKSIKDELWAEAKVCAKCKQEIHLHDDAHVDLKVPYSKGGRTVKENGQLMHRFCNMSKGANEGGATAPSAT